MINMPINCYYKHNSAGLAPDGQDLFIQNPPQSENPNVQAVIQLFLKKV
jgi:hypothetical protein